MKVRGLILTVAVLLLLGLAPMSHAANVTGISASVHPSNWDGRCPHTFQFAGEVRYVWERSDRARGEVKTLRPRGGEERFRVIEDWTLSLPRRGSFHGFEVLHILSPINIRSNRARFDLYCR